MKIERYRTDEERELILSRIHKPNVDKALIMSERMNRDVFYPLNLPEYDHLDEGFPGLKFLSPDEADHMLPDDPVVGIEHNGEIEKTNCRCDIRYISNPEPVRCIGGEITLDQIGSRSISSAPDCRCGRFTAAHAL